MTLYCLHEGPVQWYFTKSLTPKSGIFISMENNLVIYPVEIKHQGHYFCIGTENSEYFFAHVRLDVQGSPFKKYGA